MLRKLESIYRETVDEKLIGVGFGYYTSEEIKNISVKEISNPVGFDSLMRPLPSGLYDPALGVSPYDHLSR